MLSTWGLIVAVVIQSGPKVEEAAVERGISVFDHVDRVYLVDASTDQQYSHWPFRGTSPMDEHPPAPAPHDEIPIGFSENQVGRSYVRSQGNHSKAWILPTAGAITLAGGVVCFGLAQSIHSSLQGGDISIKSASEASSAARRGKVLQGVGLGLIGAGAVMLGVAAGIALFGHPAEGTTATVAPTSDGGMVASLSGVFR